MSHELRTPLNGVVAVSDLLAKEQTTDRGRQMAELVRASGRLLEQVLTDILDISRNETGQLPVNREPFDLTACAGDHGGTASRQRGDQRTRFHGHRRRSRLRLATGRRRPHQPNPLELLSNAVRFTTEGHVSLNVESDGKMTRFTVSDSGVGFAPDFQHKLFSRFEQADGSITRRFGGSGLGLAISSSLAELMGGTIAAQSEPGRGSVFSVALPLEAVSEPVAADAGQVGARDVTAMRIFVAEDHPTNRTVVSLILEQFGVDLTLVEDGCQAVEAVHRESYDLILMDLQMPVLDGLSAAREIRARETALNLGRTPIAALSANALPEHIAETRAAGMDGHLAKPIRPDALIDLLIQALDDKASQAA